jgi:hypothetical protein
MIYIKSHEYKNQNFILKAEISELLLKVSIESEGFFSQDLCKINDLDNSVSDLIEAAELWRDQMLNPDKSEAEIKIESLGFTKM